MVTKILLVDDEPDLEIMISQKFRRQVRDREMIFAFARNGFEALQILEAQNDVLVLLTDINMPEMDGLTLLGKVSENYPLVKSVIVSAYGDMANIRTALNRGAFDFLTKPIDFADLETTLKKTIHEAYHFQKAAQDHDQLVALQQELNVARQIQKTIVPRKFPPFPERQDFEIQAAMVPARDVGGDFYDFFLIDHEKLGFVIADVSGKGIPAALFMAVSKTLLKATALKGLPPAECLQEVNRILYSESIAAMFVTVFYGILNTHSGVIEYSNGGHNPPYILRADGRVENAVGVGGLVLGGMLNSAYKTHTLQLQRGEGIFLYTDGITEATDPQLEQFSETRLEESLKNSQKNSLADIVQNVSTAVKNFEQGAASADDMTILALRFFGQ